jgi:hypothetical protein
MRIKEITHSASRVKTPVRLVAMAAAMALGTLSLAFGLRCWPRRLHDRGGFQEVYRQLGVGSNDPH